MHIVFPKIGLKFFHVERISYLISDDEILDIINKSISNGGSNFNFNPLRPK